MYTADWLGRIRAETGWITDDKLRAKIQELVERAEEDREALLKMANDNGILNTVRYMLAHESASRIREQAYTSKLEALLKKHKIEIV